MALEDQIRALNWKSNYEKLTNTALSGKRYTADFGQQYWSFEIETPPLTRTDFQNNFAVLFNDIDNTAVINVKPSLLHDAGGRVGYTDPSSIGPSVLESPLASRGASQIYFELFDTTTDGMALTFGDFIQFANHDKIYMISENASLDSGDWGGAPTTAGPFLISPALMKATTTGNVRVNDLSVKVVGIGPTNEFRTNEDGVYVFSKEVREVY
jgi:hypothetical protein